MGLSCSILSVLPLNAFYFSRKGFGYWASVEYLVFIKFLCLFLLQSGLSYLSPEVNAYLLIIYVFHEKVYTLKISVNVL